MKQRHAVIVLFALIIASSFTSFDSYRSTSRIVNEDMDRALALALEEQQNDVISQDTIRTFNSHLQIADYERLYPLLSETGFPDELIMNYWPDKFFDYLGIKRG